MLCLEWRRVVMMSHVVNPLSSPSETTSGSCVRTLLTPKQIARALDVSESSIKRWCDQGVIPAHYTAGGHRRIAMGDLLEYLRTSQQQLVNPAALGLAPTSGQTLRVIDRARNELVAAILAGEEAKCRQIAIDMYLADHALSVICDELFAVAFHEIGNLWEQGDAEVYQERRACDIAVRVLRDLREQLAIVPENAPLALGCATTGDPYRLATTMAELVLRQAKWNACSLGENLPFATIDAALHTYAPRLFWISCSFLVDEREFLTGYQQLYASHGDQITFVMGGQALSTALQKKVPFATYCGNMQELQSFAQSMAASLPKGSP